MNSAMKSPLDTIRFNIGYTNSWWASVSTISRFFSYAEKIHAHTAFMLHPSKSAPGKVVLDVGFGAGYLLDRLHDALHEVSLFTGLDISLQNIFRYSAGCKKRRVDNIAVLPMSPFTSALPFSGDSIDVVFCNHVLEHVPNDSELVKEIRRILKPGACAIVMVPINEDHLAVPTHIRKYDVRGLIDLFGKDFTVYDHGVNDCFSHWIRNFALIKFPLHTLFKKTLIFMLCCCPFFLVVVLDRMLLSLGFKPAQAYARVVKKTFP